MSSKAVEIIAREHCFQGFYRLDRLKLRHKLFSGEQSAVITRELFVRPDAVCMLPYDPIQDKVVFVEQVRVGAIEKSANPWMLELVAGLIDKKDEDPQDVAYREALEEANLEITDLLPISQYYPSVGGSDEYIYLYLGRCDSSEAGGVHGLESEGEDIRTHVWTYEQAVTNLQQGLIQNAASIIALQWLMLNRDRVRQQWG
ncbi:NUDIX domain-containing protein [Entomomonas moraniae]|uniref:ADP-ribose pyrophosphatase n=1 Tax=Entomomonas moraniae TaxID=2213226 RepID=A0A3Q9JLE9_9GAMM|nr:NUDIX domain-containing protein [Entomomonas moraniae]AZS52263.1 NUDIX domain-containing protein [Entomomonas moraniae]